MLLRFSLNVETDVYLLIFEFINFFRICCTWVNVQSSTSDFVRSLCMLYSTDGAFLDIRSSGLDRLSLCVNRPCVRHHLGGASSDMELRAHDRHDACGLPACGR